MSICTGNYATAQKHLGAALDIAAKIGDNSTQGLILTTLGHVHKDKGEYSKGCGMLRPGRFIFMRKTPTNLTRKLSCSRTWAISIPAWGLLTQAAQAYRAIPTLGRKPGR